MKPSQDNQRTFRDLELLSRFMDSQFKIPGTNIRFGIDSIVGLIPGVGDLTTLAVSGYMVAIMARKGASGFVMARMVLNILIDAVLGIVPVIGDIFDIAFKANDKNFRLLKQHYGEGRHQGGAWKVILPLVIAFILISALVVWSIYRLLVWAFS